MFIIAFMIDSETVIMLSAWIQKRLNFSTRFETILHYLQLHSGWKWTQEEKKIDNIKLCGNALLNSVRARAPFHPFPITPRTWYAVIVAKCYKKNTFIHNEHRKKKNEKRSKNSPLWNSSLLNGHIQWWCWTVSQTNEPISRPCEGHLLFCHAEDEIQFHLYSFFFVHPNAKSHRPFSLTSHVLTV